MTKIHSYKITKTIIPIRGSVLCETFFDLYVKTTRNCKHPYRLYSGRDFNELIDTANKYNLSVNKSTLVNVLDFSHSNHINTQEVWVLNTK